MLKTGFAKLAEEESSYYLLLERGLLRLGRVKNRIYFVLVIFIVIYHKCFDVLRIDISLL